MYCLEGLPTFKECGRDDYFDKSHIYTDQYGCVLTSRQY